MKNNFYFKIGVIIIISIILFGGFTILLLNNNGRSISMGNNKAFNLKTIEKQYVSTEDITSLTLDFDIGDIIIQPTDSLETSITYHDCSDFKYHFEVKDNQLIVNQSLVKHFNNVNFTKKTIIYLPVKVYEKIKIHTNLGQLKIDSIEGNNLDIHTNLGEVDINNSVFNTSTISSNLGEITINNFTGKDSISIKTDLGEIDLSEVYVPNITAETSLGRIDYINKDKDYKFNSFEMKTSLGDKNINVGK